MSVARATVRRVRVATWNVNSVKQRVPRLLPWLDQRQPDVVCLQETKLTDDAFRELLGEELARRGYAVALYGEARWMRSGRTRCMYRTGGCRAPAIITTSSPGWPRWRRWSPLVLRPQWYAGT